MLLAVDTSTAQVGLAVYDGAQVAGEYAWRSSQRHTVELAPAVFELLARCGLTMDDIRALGVALGPGSFTSLRVGLSLVKGFALARGLPLIGIPTLDILAAAQPLSKLPLLVAIQAGRGRLAAGWYKRSKGIWKAKDPARVITAKLLVEEAKSPVIVCAELTAEEREMVAANSEIQLVSPVHSIRRPAVLAELAWKRWQAGDVDDRATLAPIYLHIGEPIPV
ncbi:MAG TPA: tRNA (adenosine(37)-N6)-threonylcarbamoyltransferase complex dimerization subunit type 1 TsaB [Anaerolineales bacterium]|jgi:tRNA threonylcarbamoyladenosine biosynthesis protein TsaB|nr:tRNA (adenosine(37)-N6)-threonylcarbamoyltransferase complex dimerization subunit type 1 TsaB [Anaerolineales bacterium]